MEHYITGIEIINLRHLSKIAISLNNEKRQHLIITGKNGSGKTSLLLSLAKNFQALDDGNLTYLLTLEDKIKHTETTEELKQLIQSYSANLPQVKETKGGLDIQFSSFKDLDVLYKQGDFITAFFPANRKTNIDRYYGVKDIKLEKFYSVYDNPGALFQQYLVHLKTQQSYARNEGDLENAGRIQKWFDRFTDALKILLDDNSISLEYDYKNYNFK